MQITNDGTTSPAAAAGAAASATQSPVGGMANEQTFLQLLVAQIKNQDPMQPTDSMQFVSQLAQFSSLEQLININQGITNLNTDLTAGSGTPAPTPSPTTN